jgi:DHA1 family multidrug resistance protein-like MFS transporter
MLSTEHKNAILEGFKGVVRDAPFGQMLRYATGNRVLKYPEELEGFKCPRGYDNTKSKEDHANHNNPTPPITPTAPPSDPEKVLTEPDFDNPPSAPPTNIAKPLSYSSSESDDLGRTATSTTQIVRTHTLPYTQERLEADISLHRTKSTGHAVAPTRTADGLILVDWYTTTDPENPQNWSQAKKAWTAFLVCLYTFVVYASSSIYVSSEILIMERFGVGDFKASLGLALYVLGKLNSYHQSYNLHVDLCV